MFSYRLLLFFLLLILSGNLFCQRHYPHKPRVRVEENVSKPKYRNLKNVPKRTFTKPNRTKSPNKHLKVLAPGKFIFMHFVMMLQFFLFILGLILLIHTGIPLSEVFIQILVATILFFCGAVASVIVNFKNSK